MNPRWHDLVADWEEKYGLEFHLDGRITARLDKAGWASKVKTKDPSTPAEPR